MAVLVPCQAEDVGAFCLIDRTYGDPLSGIPTGWKNAVANNYQVREVYEGRVLSTGERNGYHDSDFDVTVWDDETDGPRTFVYATTRAPTYHLYAHVDATPEIVAKAKARQAYAERRGRIMNRRANSKARFDLARSLGVSPDAVTRLVVGLGERVDHRKPAPAADRYNRDYRSLALSMGFYRQSGDLDRVTKLVTSFRSNRLRSEFKKKLAQQVIDWLNDPQPRYPTPLSKRQLAFI